MLFLLARVVGEYLGPEVMGGVAVGAVIGLALTASYKRNRQAPLTPKPYD